jgi:hypothetical protein
MNSAGNSDVAEYYAIFLMTIILSINFIFLYALFYVFLGLKLDAKLFTGLLFVGFLILFYFKFIHKDRFVVIAKEYENETSKKRILGNIFIIGYIIISIGLLMLGVYLMMQKNKGLI